MTFRPSGKRVASSILAFASIFAVQIGILFSVMRACDEQERPVQLSRSQLAGSWSARDGGTITFFEDGHYDLASVPGPHLASEGSGRQTFSGWWILGNQGPYGDGDVNIGLSAGKEAVAPYVTGNVLFVRETAGGIALQLYRGDPDENDVYTFRRNA